MTLVGHSPLNVDVLNLILFFFFFFFWISKTKKEIQQWLHHLLQVQSHRVINIVVVNVTFAVNNQPQVA